MTKLPVKKSVIKAWVKELRSGKYEQTQHQLQDALGFCCLGVACQTFIPTERAEFGDEGYLEGCTPPDQPKAPAWLRAVNHDFETRTGRALTALNDGLFMDMILPAPGTRTVEWVRFKFDEIADLLEAVYINDALGVACR